MVAHAGDVVGRLVECDESGERLVGEADPGTDVLGAQRPRQQSRAEVVPLRRGDLVVFPVRERPVQGARGWHRRAMRHGVSRVRSGLRVPLGLIVHDAL